MKRLHHLYNSSMGLFGYDQIFNRVRLWNCIKDSGFL